MSMCDNFLVWTNLKEEPEKPKKTEKTQKAELKESEKTSVSDQSLFDGYIITTQGSVYTYNYDGLIKTLNDFCLPTEYSLGCSKECRGPHVEEKILDILKEKDIEIETSFYTKKNEYYISDYHEPSIEYALEEISGKYPDYKPLRYALPKENNIVKSPEYKHGFNNGYIYNKDYVCYPFSIEGLNNLSHDYGNISLTMCLDQHNLLSPGILSVSSDPDLNENSQTKFSFMFIQDDSSFYQKYRENQEDTVTIDIQDIYKGKESEESSFIIDIEYLMSSIMNMDCFKNTNNELEGSAINEYFVRYYSNYYPNRLGYDYKDFQEFFFDNKNSSIFGEEYMDYYDYFY